MSVACFADLIFGSSWRIGWVMNPVKFEYKIMPVDVGDTESLAQDEGILNELGQQGWELVAAVPIVHDPKKGTFRVDYCLKRPLA
jgi:hypothetical protein